MKVNDKVVTTCNCNAIQQIKKGTLKKISKILDAPEIYYVEFDESCTGCSEENFNCNFNKDEIRLLKDRFIGEYRDYHFVTVWNDEKAIYEGHVLTRCKEKINYNGNSIDEVNNNMRQKIDEFIGD
jgi:hypothetical protein